MADPKPAQQGIPIWIVVVAIAAYFLFVQQKTPVPNPSPLPQAGFSVQEKKQIAECCKAMSAALQANYFKTGSDVPEAWGYAAQFSFGAGAKLSPEASQWVKSAELRMQPIFGGAGGTAKELDPSSRAAGALLFTTLANELEAK